MPEDKDKPKEKRTPARPPAGDVFDVRRPGKALASPTSRPVIMGHKPEAQAAQAAVSGIGEASPTLARRKIQIMPSGNIQAVEAGTPEKEEAEALQTEPKAKDIPEEDKEALAAAAIDGASGPPDLPEQKPEPESKEKPLLPEQKQTTEPEDKPSGEDGDRAMVFTKPKLVIEPPKEEQEPADTPEAEGKPEPAEAAPADGKEKLVSDEKTESKESEEPAPATEESSAKPLAEEAATDSAQDTPAEAGEAPQEEQKPEPHIDPLFDEHGVIVSHHDSTHHRGSGLKTFLLVLLILALAVAALDILLDLEILQLDGVPHTDFL